MISWGCLSNGLDLYLDLFSPCEKEGVEFMIAYRVHDYRLTVLPGQENQLRMHFLML